MNKFTNIGLVEFVKKALSEKWGYVYGTIGQVLTSTILEQKRKQYPDNINKYLAFIQKNWLGRRTTDCVNLIKAYLWWNEDKNNPVYSVEYDKYEGVWMSADGAYSVATEKGNLNTLPDVPGVCVRYKGHIGVYIGGGEVIEARGTKYGVVKTKLKDRPWTHWLKYPGIEYLEEVSLFNDIKGHFAEKYIKTVSEAGLMVGDGNGNFEPDCPLTRAQLAIVLCKALNLPVE